MYYNHQLLDLQKNTTGQNFKKNTILALKMLWFAMAGFAVVQCLGLNSLVNSTLQIN